MATIVHNIRLPQDTWDALTKAADAAGRSRNNLIYVWLVDKLASEGFLADGGKKMKTKSQPKQVA